MKIRFFDILIIFFFIIIIIFISYNSYIKPSDKNQVFIQSQNSEWIYNLEAEETITVTGPIGETVVRVAGGCAWVESSPCDNQNCVAAGFVRKPGQWAACLPNQVLVIIKGSEVDEVDAISR